MSELLNNYLVSLIVPQNLALSLLIVGFLFYVIRWRRLGFLAMLSGVCWLVAWSLPMTSIKAGSYLEQQYAIASYDEVPKADAIVVLGGNTAGNRVNWFSESASEGAVHRRIDTAAALYQKEKAPLIIVSGGANEGDISEARGMEHNLRNLGVPAEAIIREDHSTTTRENAIYTQRIIQARDIDSVLVVTSALHMPRSMGVFERLDINAEAVQNPPQITVPADDASFNPWFPNLRALAASRSIIKEYLGYWVYQFRGWI